ncbi:hypothetical protein EMPG_16846 [Blastomyces silverae]|uniref:Uncharacterized protein n=1 Tax=Blastomyces silverae TaxID=2060906 RepID=A0A0H1B8F5_9EURO|nr:hypothetical protein EMPG_16846 [Blastomyces silverae]
MAGKKPTPRRRGRPSKASTAGSASDHELAGILSNPADIFKDLSSAAEKRNKDKWQRLSAQHKAQVKKTEEGIQSIAHSNKSALLRHRRAQIKRLSDLVKKRTEIETEIVADMQRLGDLYEAASGELNSVLTSRLFYLQ